MKTIDQLIQELQKAKKLIGGDAPVLLTNFDGHITPITSYPVKNADITESNNIKDFYIIEPSDEWLE